MLYDRDAKLNTHKKMPELECRDRRSSRSTEVGRAPSTDSLHFTTDSNFSLFSSASASIDRCSFASDADADDYESLSSVISLHLTAQNRYGDCSSLDPIKMGTPKRKSSEMKVAVQKEYSKGNLEEGNQQIDSARNSFSLALKECQGRKSRSEALLKKLDMARPASLDLNKIVSAAASPKLETASISLVAARKSGNFPSPGTPNYRHPSIAMQKGWSSERVASSTNAGRRQVGVAVLPFNNVRGLPSKWEDAERWILSPVKGDGVAKASLATAPLRRPKSKSGPLGPPGLAYYSLYSPAFPMFEGRNMESFMTGFPFPVMAADEFGITSDDNRAAFPGREEACMARSVSIHGCSDTLTAPSIPFKDETPKENKDAATDTVRTVSRRDMATQMSPQGSIDLSPKGGSSFFASASSALSVVEPQSSNSSRSEVRDVQVDERVSMTRWSKKHAVRNRSKRSPVLDDCKTKAMNPQASAWDQDVTETVEGHSKVKREEAKITAWENLQKAKAEAAMRKLEMKLEKKRSSSMEKIMNKLKSAQKRADDLRNSVSANEDHENSRKPPKALSFYRTRQMGSLSGCFTCHAF